jgi:hypothetical protein
MFCAAALALGAAATGAAPGAPGPRTGACTARMFTVSFAPARNAVVKSRGTRLGVVSFTSRWLSPACHRVAQRRAFAGTGLGLAMRRSVLLRCTAPKPIRIQVHPVLSGDSNTIIGSVLIVGTAGPLRAIVSVVLKNKGDPQASRIYWAGRYCGAA